MRRIRIFSGRRGRRVVMIGGISLLVVVALAAAPAVFPARGGNAMFSDIASPAMADARVPSEGVCWADYDGDGDRDLFVANARGPSRLWRNDGNATFTDVGATAGVSGGVRTSSCAFVDLDNDGDPDLFINSRNNKKNPPSQNRLFRNNGNGTFIEIKAAGVGMPGVGTASSDWADFDVDGDYDGFVAARYRGGIRLNAFFEQVRPLVFTDIGRKTGLDNPQGPQRAFLGSWFDYDADGDPDLMLAIDFYGVDLYRNDRGRFVRVTAETLPPAGDKTPGAPPNNSMGVAWGDYDNDGCFDVFITGMNMTAQSGFAEKTLSDLPSRLYRSTCKGTFTDATEQAGFLPTGVLEWSTSFIDFDNDGDLDLSVVAGNAMMAKGEAPAKAWKRQARRVRTVIVTVIRKVLPLSYGMYALAYRYEAMIPVSGASGVAAAMPNYLYQNMLVETGKPTFVDVTQKVGVGNLGPMLGSAWADMDNDGDLDWFIPSRSMANRLFRNNGPAGNYLSVHLVGRRFRDAVGAWVRIRSGSGIQVRHVHVLDGFLSQSQMDPHFGLGRAQTVDEISVRWPGTTTWVRACGTVPANSKVTITQGEGCVW